MAQILEEDISAFHAATDLIRLENAGEEPGANSQTDLKTRRRSVDALFESRRSLQRERDELKQRVEQYLLAFTRDPAEDDQAPKVRSLEYGAQPQGLATRRPGPKPRKVSKHKIRDLSNFTDAAGLTERQQECFSLRLECDWTVTEIARHLAKDPATIREHISAATKKVEQFRVKQKNRARGGRSDPENLRGSR